MRILILVLIVLAPAAHAGDPEDVREFFEAFVKRANSFDPGVADLYSPDARIITLRDGDQRVELSGSQWKELLVKAMPIAKKRGDTNTFEDIEVVGREVGFRVTAIRTPAVKCTADPNYHLDVAQVEGEWRVVEEYTETVSLSQCKPSKELAASLEALRRGLEPRLPADLDADSRLESVEVVGSNLIYNQRLHTASVDELDLPQAQAIMRQLGVQYACGPPEMRALVEQGATIRYSTVDRDGAPLAQVDIMPGMCPPDPGRR